MTVYRLVIPPHMTVFRAPAWRSDPVAASLPNGRFPVQRTHSPAAAYSMAGRWAGFLLCSIVACLLVGHAAAVVPAEISTCTHTSELAACGARGAVRPLHAAPRTGTMRSPTPLNPNYTAAADSNHSAADPQPRQQRPLPQPFTTTTPTPSPTHPPTQTRARSRTSAPSRPAPPSRSSPTAPPAIPPPSPSPRARRSWRRPARAATP